MRKWSDRRFVLTVIIISIIAKLIIVIAYYHLWLIPGNKDLIAPDGEWFIQRGWYIAKGLSGKIDYEVPSREFVFRGFERVVDYYKGKLPPFNSRANGLFTYCIGFIFFWFGYVPLLIKTLNILISAISAILVYLLALEIYGNKVARRAVVLFTFFPTIFIFSSTALRDPLTVLCIVTILYALVKLNGKPAIGNFILLGMALLLILFLREELFVLMSLTALFVCILNKKMRFKITAILLVALFLALATHTDLFYKIKFQPKLVISNIGPMIFAKNAALYHTGGRLAYKIFPDRQYDLYKRYSTGEEYFKLPQKITTIEVAKALPKAVFFYFTRPFPFVQGDLVYNLISIFIVFWYLFLVVVVFGIVKARSPLAYPLFIYALVMVLTTCMVEVNGGILLRHRDLLVPVFIIFASAAGKVTDRGQL